MKKILLYKITEDFIRSCQGWMLHIRNVFRTSERKIIKFVYPPTDNCEKIMHQSVYTIHVLFFPGIPRKRTVLLYFV